MANYKSNKGRSKYSFLKGAKLAGGSRTGPAIEADSGLLVRSKYEKCCVRFFKENNIEFQYEPLILLSGRQYRPDFFLPRYNLFIELCGYTHMPFYCDRLDKKKQLYAHHNLKALFIVYRGKGSLTELLRRELRSAGLAL